MTVEEMVTRDPRGRSEEEWLDVLELLLSRLEGMTGSKIEVGAYWMDVRATSASAALGARIRADGPLLGTASDCWEAALCITGDQEGAYVDAMAFPFLRGSVVNRDGRLVDLPGNSEVDELWLHHEEGRWEDKGFRYPDGPGEWDHIRAPGDAFFRNLFCSAVRPEVAAGEPVAVTVDHRAVVEVSLEVEAAVSIHRLWRDGREIVEAPPATPLPRPGSERRLAVELGDLPGEVRLDALSIPGGWAPGRYRIELRLHHAPRPTSRDADISEPVEIKILGRRGRV